MKKIKRGVPVSVRWFDSYTPAEYGWLTGKQFCRHTKKPPTLKSVGMVISIDDHFLNLCGSRQGNGGKMYNAIFSIPIGCIKKVRVLR